MKIEDGRATTSGMKAKGKEISGMNAVETVGEMIDDMKTVETKFR